jgi:hypothetical protein
MRPLKLVNFDPSTKALQFEKFLKCHGYFAFFILIQTLMIELYSREVPFDLLAAPKASSQIIEGLTFFIRVI